MKKFISFVMAAAMVASLVPATAFAGNDLAATVKVVGGWTELKDSAKIGTNGQIVGAKMPEVQLKVTAADQRRWSNNAAELPEAKVRLVLDNAYFKATTLSGQTTKSAVENLGGEFAKGIQIVDKDGQPKKDSSYAPDTPAKTAYTYTAATSGAIADIYIADQNDSTLANYGFAPSSTAVDGTEYSRSQMQASPTVKAVMDGVEREMVDATDAEMIEAVFNALKEANVDTEIENLDSGFGFDATDSTTIKKVTDAVNGVGIAPVTPAKADGSTITFISASAIESLTGKAFPADFAKKPGDNDDWKEALEAALNAAATGKALVQETDASTAASAGTAPTAKKVGLKKIELLDDDEVEITFEGYFEIGDTISIDLRSQMDKKSKDAKVSVYGDFAIVDDLTYVAIEGRSIAATTRKVATVAEEEFVTLASDIVINSKVDDFVTGQWFELKLSKGFEFTSKCKNGADYIFEGRDGNTMYMQFNGTGDKITIDKDDIQIEATSAKSGAVCTMTVKALNKAWDDTAKELVPFTGAGSDKVFNASATVEIMKVVDYKVELSVDEDEDVPAIYSGVNVANYGITDDSDHWSLEVTAKETFPGAWSFRKGFNFELPEGVYVTDVKVVDTDAFLKADTASTSTSTEAGEGEVYKAFFDAYQNGSHVNFEFKKRVFDDVDTILSKDVASMTFKLQLVADPTFEGDVVLKLTGDLVDEQEVTIAKFVKPYTVKAEQNDIIIDYRYTDIPTAITITEAEAGLWAKNEATFKFSVEKGISQTFMAFEKDPTFEVDSKSDMQLKNAKANNGTIEFTVKAESDEAATIEIKDMQLFMNRSIPAGPYDLSIGSTLADKYEAEVLFAKDHDTCSDTGVVTPGTCTGSVDDKDCFVRDVCDYSSTVKEAFVNVITAGRDVDDASFTTKVVVPIGESYLIAGEKQVELDTPAYINEAGYTMLPIRAVATALGINTNNVLWDQPTKTVTILYGQRIITMTQGQKVVYVNGSAIPASAAVENVNSRTFLPMRDLATALGVTDITWDQATRTATLNGNQK